MNNLEELINSYAENKEKLDSYKSICDKENGEIKTLMAELDLSRAETETFIATVTVQRRENMDEDKLLEVLRNNGYAGAVIRTKEYVDMDLLEDAMYHEKIDTETLAQMETCKIVKEIPTLKIKRKKGK